MSFDETQDSSRSNAAVDRGASAPGLLLVFNERRALHHALPLSAEPLSLGRTSLARDFQVEDSRASREHAKVSYSDGLFIVSDENSKNGTFVDGQRITQYRGAHPRVLRIGDTLFVFSDDIRAHLTASMQSDGATIGPRLGQVYREIAELAAGHSVLHLTGDTGAGKELAARYFHDSSRTKGPFVAINCATLVPQLAERLLFGTVRGAYSGAEADAPGCFQTADGGTLFLDEISELQLEVQAKLLRVLETHEVLPLGAKRAIHIDVRVCSATHEKLEVAVDRGRFRRDLFYRLARPVVAIPSLRERLEDVPWLIERALSAAQLEAHITLVESALMRLWPGNIRELLLELGSAVRLAKRESSTVVKGRHFAPEAGLLTPKVGQPDAPEKQSPEADTIRAVLAHQKGNVAATARALGMHRTQLRRALARLGISTGGAETSADTDTDGDQ